MAKNSTIKGITIEIGGDVSPLSKALAEVSQEGKSIQSQLRAVNELLKFDPTNTEAIAQKQKLLAEAAENAKRSWIFCGRRKRKLKRSSNPEIWAKPNTRPSKPALHTPKQR